jgi:hypothetical protein
MGEAAEGFAPSAEVHVNIWRNKERGKIDHFDLFDIGFRFKELRSLKSLSLRARTHNQKLTVAAMQIAARKLAAFRS